MIFLSPVCAVAAADSFRLARPRGCQILRCRALVQPQNIKSLRAEPLDQHVSCARKRRPCVVGAML
jgi:hypothetical protein